LDRQTFHVAQRTLKGCDGRKPGRVQCTLGNVGGQHKKVMLMTFLFVEHIYDTIEKNLEKERGGKNCGGSSHIPFERDLRKDSSDNRADLRETGGIQGKRGIAGA